MSDLIEYDWQMERNGVLLGDDTVYDLRLIKGLAGQPATVASDRALSQRHGSIAGKDFLQPRVITLTFEVVEDSASTLGEKLHELSKALTPSVDEMRTSFRIPGVGKGLTVTTKTHVRAKSVPIDTEYSRGVATVTAQLSAADPRLYSAVQKTGQVNSAESTTLGLEFDVTPDIGFGGPVLPGVLEINNEGNFFAPLKFRVYGPVVDPVVTRVSDGLYMAFNTTIADGDYLEVDSETRTVKLNGLVNSYSVLDSSSTWLELAAGTDELRLTRTGADNAALVVYYYDTFI